MCCVSVMLAVCLIHPAAQSAAAQTDEAPKAEEAMRSDGSESAAMKSELSRKVSLKISDLPVKGVVSQLAAHAKATMILDKRVLDDRQAISLDVRNMAAREALEKIAEKIEAKVYVRDGAYFISCDRPPVTETKPLPGLTEDQKRAVAEAIGRLGDEDFEVREAATLAIRGIGPGTRPQLEAAKRTATDREVQVRLLALTRQFQFALDGEGGSDALAAVLARTVSFEVEDVPLAEMAQYLESLVDDTCVRFKTDPKLDQEVVTLQVFEMPLGHVLRWVARLTNTTLRRKGHIVTISR